MPSMNDLIPEEHREVIESILARYDLPPDTLVITDSIPNWCHNHGIHDDDMPWLMGKAVIVGGQRRILILDMIPASSITAMIVKLAVCGMAKQANALKSEARFLEQLVLHEIGHFVTKSALDDVADSWAFGEMGIAQPPD